ncbi:MAG: MjaI family restriction endonuclease [Alistipes onderdonkii]|nr:MAG TPA: MjaI restriction endonuclease [Caudoviricetes sp.]
MKLRIPNAEVQELLSDQSYAYPKYATQILNLANQNAQGTRPSVVGQMSDLIQEFGAGTMAQWDTWYKAGHPEAVDAATERVFRMVELFKESIQTIDKEMVRKWVEELVVVKTYCGLKFQEAILRKIAEGRHTTHRLATPDEEAQGVDGYIGEQAVSIKPITYRVMNELPEQIDVPIIFYDKKKSEIVVEYNF